MKLFIATLLVMPSLLCFGSSKTNNQLMFHENIGQIKDQYLQPRADIDFAISSSGLNIFVGNGHIHYQFHKQSDDNKSSADEGVSLYRMDVELLNANKNVRIIREGRGEDFERYYNLEVGRTAYSYNRIIYKDIYPSIDWVLYIKDNMLEYDFIIHKGGDIKNIKLQYNGATSLALNDNGSLTSVTPMGNITEAAPYSYQKDGTQVASSFVLNDNILTFATAAYKNDLVIDPKLEWSTYYGGDFVDYRSSVACDDSGYVYLAGRTTSINNIATIGSFQATFNGIQDAYLCKFNAAGERLWATYYGGTGDENDVTVTCDKFYNVYLAGSTNSATNISSPGSHQENILNSNSHPFLVKFNYAGERLWGTYYGGDSSEHGAAIACDDSGNVYLTGVTNSTINISTPGTHQPSYAGTNMFISSDAFLVKFDSSGVRQWGTYYGGSDIDYAYSVVTDAAGNVYISGQTSSLDAMFSTGAHQPTPGGDLDAFVAKFTNTGQRVWGTYYGGGDVEYGFSLASRGDYLYLFDLTSSANNIATTGSFQPTFGAGGGDVYLVKFDTSGTRVWATYYGSAGLESLENPNGHKVAVDDNGNIYFVFFEENYVSNMATNDGPQTNFGGDVDVVLAKFNSGGTREWATYFGTCGEEIDGGCALDNNGNIYICGTVTSDHMATRGSHQIAKAGVWDHFLAKFNNDTLGIQGDTAICPGSIITYYASFVPGAESYTWALPNGWTGSSTVDTINVTAGTTSGTLSVVANKGCSTEPAQELFITVYPIPVVNISISGSVLTATPGFVSYQWYDQAGAITGAINQTYTISGPGDYYVVIEDTNGCTSQSNTLPVDIQELVRSNGVYLYPNPNDGDFDLIVSGLDDSQHLDLEIIDVTGHIIYQNHYALRDGSLEISIKQKDKMAQGSYILKLKTAQTTQVVKFVKQ